MRPAPAPSFPLFSPRLFASLGLSFFISLSSFKAAGFVFSLDAAMGKRKIDPETGKPIPHPSDVNRKKRPSRKLITPAVASGPRCVVPPHAACAEEEKPGFHRRIRLCTLGRQAWVRWLALQRRCTCASCGRAADGGRDLATDLGPSMGGQCQCDINPQSSSARLSFVKWSSNMSIASAVEHELKAP